MSLRDDLTKKIEEKRQEIRDLELEIREANAYIQGLQDVLDLMPRDSPREKSKRILRTNSDVEKVRVFLKSQGKPMHIGQILDGIGKGDTKQNRLSLSGSLGDYVRKGEVFIRPAPNTFGLTEFKNDKIGQNEPPEDFGIPSTKQNPANEFDPFADE